MSKVTAALATSHPVSLDIGKARMAKADVQLPDIDWNGVISSAIRRAVKDVWEDHKVAAGEIGVDASEFGKWLNGTRRPQLDKLWSIARLRQPLCVRFAQLAGAEIHTRVEWPVERIA